MSGFSPQYKKDIDAPEVDLKAIEILRNQLKVYDIKWAAHLADKMFPLSEKARKADPDNKKGQTKVYNIITGSTANNGSRALWIVKGKELLDEYRDRQEQVDKIIEQEQLLSSE